MIGHAYVRPTTTTRHEASKRLIGESTILLRHPAASAELQLLPVQVGTRTMSDVWSGRPAGSSTSSAFFYVTASGVPHVGGPPAPNGAMVCVYVLVSNKLAYVAYLDETSGKFRSYVGADTQYSVAPSSPTPHCSCARDERAGAGRAVAGGVEECAGTQKVFPRPQLPRSSVGGMVGELWVRAPRTRKRRILWGAMCMRRCGWRSGRRAAWRR